MRYFRRALDELGYSESSLIIEARFYEGDMEQLQAAIAELVRAPVDVLVTLSTRPTLLAKQATSTIPIVFASVFDPVGSGIVANLARPGGNITGAAVGVGGAGLGGKWLQLLKEIAPKIDRVGVLANPDNPASMASANEAANAAPALGIGLDLRQVKTAQHLQTEMAAIENSRAGGLLVTNDPIFTNHRDEILSFAARTRTPAIYYYSLFVERGGLISYGAEQADSIRRAARYVDKILRGARPGDLPIDQPTHFSLHVNLKTAAELGLAVPAKILAQADQLIE